MKLKQVLKKINHSSPPPQGGYTIIESLVAMVMVAALMVAVAPVIVFSVGTRVQARRIELGAQAARSYIDAVRLNPEFDDAADSDDDDGLAPNLIAVDLDDAPAPTSGNLECNAGEYCTTPTRAMYDDLYCVDNDGDGKCTRNSLVDMVVQGLRSQEAGTSFTADEGYALGVRVYRADAFQETTLETGTQQSAVTNAIGNRSQPIIEIVTEIAPTDNSFQNLRDRL
jgi:type II secretory pathway pseudopilin PulG